MSDIVWPNGSKTKPRVTGSYGPRKSFWTPGGWTNPFHYGTDIVGFPMIKSPVNGVVVYAGYNGGFGNFVRIRAGGPNAFVKGDEFGHAHLKDIRVRAGQSVRLGQDIGLMGTTGRSTGVHLHWEVYPNGGAAVNAEIYMSVALASTAADDVKPLPPKDIEEEDDMGNKNVTQWFKKPNEQTYIYLCYNLSSGAYHEFGAGAGRGTLPGEYTKRFAETVDSAGWGEITPSHAAVIKATCASLRPKDAPDTITVIIDPAELDSLSTG